MRCIILFVSFAFTVIACNKERDKDNLSITEPSSKGEIVHHTFYTLSYSEENEQSEWVFYKLTSDMLLGTQQRTEDFRSDPLVKTGSAQLIDYSGSGYDRGHLCPAADMTISFTSMSESFYLSNISPQVDSFNRGIWEKLESATRNFARTEKEIYIVTGPVFKNNKGTIGTNNVTIPGFFFKVIYAPLNNKMIGFILPNEKGTKNIEKYAVTVDSVENITNLNIFPELSLEIQNDLESKIDIYKWSFTIPSVINPTPIPSDCPTTSNCGCSNKNKLECQTSPCCQWIVGTGCKCR